MHLWLLFAVLSFAAIVGLTIWSWRQRYTRMQRRWVTMVPTLVFVGLIVTNKGDWKYLVDGFGNPCAHVFDDDPLLTTLGKRLAADRFETSCAVNYAHGQLTVETGKPGYAELLRRAQERSLPVVSIPGLPEAAVIDGLWTKGLPVVVIKLDEQGGVLEFAPSDAAIGDQELTGLAARLKLRAPELTEWLAKRRKH